MADKLDRRRLTVTLPRYQWEVILSALDSEYDSLRRTDDTDLKREAGMLGNALNALDSWVN